METIKLHQFTIGDVEDPDLVASMTVAKWMDTPHGRYVDKHAKDVKLHWSKDPASYGHVYFLSGKLEPKHLTYFRLKFA